MLKSSAAAASSVESWFISRKSTATRYFSGSRRTASRTRSLTSEAEHICSGLSSHFWTCLGRNPSSSSISAKDSEGLRCRRSSVPVLIAMLVSQVENLDRPWKRPIFSNAFKNTSCVASRASSMFPTSPANAPKTRRECRRTSSSKTLISPRWTRATSAASGSSGTMTSEVGRDLPEKGYKIFWAENSPWREIGCGPDARLHTIEEVGQTRHHDRLEGLELCKALRAEPLCLKS